MQLWEAPVSMHSKEYVGKRNYFSLKIIHKDKKLLHNRRRRGIEIKILFVMKYGYLDHIETIYIPLLNCLSPLRKCFNNTYRVSQKKCSHVWEAITPPNIALGTKVGWFLKSSGPPLSDGHWNFLFLTIEGWENWV